MVAIVGIGSMAFHSTLKRSMQLADELPMVWANAFYLYAVVTIYDKPGYIRKKLIIIILTITIVCTIYQIWFASSHLPFLIIFVSYLAIVVGRVIQIQSHNHITILPMLSVIMFGLGVAAWIIERSFCSLVQPMNLHAWVC